MPIEESPPLRERMKSLTFAYLLRTCALAALLTFPAIAVAETNLRAADQMVRQAKAWNAAGKYEEAREALVRYLERDSRSVVARLEYARTLSYLRQFPEALAEYQNVLKLEPENLEALVGVAKVASWRGQFENALNLYRQILAQTPGLHDALVGKAHTLVWLGRKDEAKEVFLDAIERNPSDRDVRRLLEDMDVDVDAALAAAQKRAALSVRPEPQLAVLPNEIPANTSPTDPPPAVPSSESERHAKPAAPVRRNIVRAPPPATEANVHPTQVQAPTPLLMHAATILILLAGGALAYRTRAVQMRRRPLPVTRRPYELPPSSLFVEVNAEKTTKAEKAGGAVKSEKVEKPGKEKVEKVDKTPKVEERLPHPQPATAHVGAGAPACPAERSAEASASPTRPAKVEPPATQEQPAKVEPPAKIEQPAPSARPGTLLWGRVLVVHPDEQVLEFTRRVLAGAGAEVLAVRRGEEAMIRLERSRLEKSSYDALLVNDRLPGGWTGMEIYRWVKQHQPGAERSVMLVHSGQSDTHTEQFLEESGALGFTAPFSGSDLIAMTRLALDKAKAGKSSIDNSTIVN